MENAKSNEELKSILSKYSAEEIFETLREMKNKYQLSLANKIYYMVQEEKDIELVKDWMDTRNVKVDDIEDLAYEYRELVDNSLGEDFDIYLYACLALHSK